MTTTATKKSSKKKAAEKKPAKAEKPAGPPPSPKEMGEDDLRKEVTQLRRAGKEVLDAELKVQEAEEAWKTTKATASDRKKVYDEAVASLRELVRDVANGQGRLF